MQNTAQAGIIIGDETEIPHMQTGLDPELRSRVEAMLEPGESIRWIAQAAISRSPHFAAEGWSPYWIIAGIAGVFEAFALVALYVLRDAKVLIYVAVGLVFIGLALALRQRDVNARRAAGRRIFAITERRIFDADVAGVAPLVSFAVAEIGYAEANRTHDGFGDIEFGCGESGASAKDAHIFHHWRGVPQVNEAMKALERLKRDHGQKLVRTAPDDEEEASIRA